MHKKRFFTLIFFTIFSSSVFAGILSSPRKAKIITTQYFEIIFPDESVVTANHIAESADSLFEKALEVCGTENVNSSKLLVVISPDSDVLSVEYSPMPYNRIVIYDGVPDVSDSCYDDVILSLFYREVLTAVKCSVRGPFDQFVAKFLSVYQPVDLINAQDSLIQGSVNVDESDEFFGRLNDSYYLEIISQAKFEGKVPNWIQAFSKKDIYPGDELIYAVCTAFMAYVQQRWGFEKYIEFWHECGKLQLSFSVGIFYKVYKYGLSSAWKDFIESIPLPANPEQMKIADAASRELIENDDEGLYQYILPTKYGFVWYDGIRHEVDIYDINSEVGIRQLLFLADDVTNLTVSPDERFLVISFIQNKNRDNFKQNAVLIYDLKNREFISNEYYIRDASIIVLEDGFYGLAGIDVTLKHPKLVIYRAAEINNLLAAEKKESAKQRNELIFSRDFEQDVLPSSPVYAGRGKVLCLVENKNEWNFLQINMADKTEKIYSIWDDDDEEKEQKLKLKNLRYLVDRNSVDSQNSYYGFQFVSKNEVSFTRMGYISLTEDLELDNAYIQTVDIPGGVNYPIIKGEDIYYVSKKINHNEFRHISKNFLALKEISIYEEEMYISYYDYDADPEIVSEKIKHEARRRKKTVHHLNEYQLETYNPLKYMFKGPVPGGITPFLAIRDINLDEGAVNWPGLGLTFVTHSDPFLNNEVSISAAYGFLNLDFTKLFNPSKELIAEKEVVNRENEKRAVFAAYVSNYSTPVDINAGGIFKFNENGQYELKTLAGTAWHVPMGMTFRDLSIKINAEYSAATDYYDINKIDTHPNLSNWPALKDVYSVARVSSSIEYTNVNQYGISAFERRGITLGSKVYAFWDFYENARINAEKKEQEQLQNNETENTTQYQSLYSDFMDSITQCNISLYGSLEIPRLTPLKMYNGWVLSVPSKLNAAIMNETGKALDVSGEMLLLGKEIQNGIGLLYLYFARAGLKFGYDMNLYYDTNVMSLPDIREIARFTDVFRNTHFDDNFYFKLNLDFITPIGRLSSNIFTTEMKFAFYPRSNGFLFSFNFEAKF